MLDLDDKRDTKMTTFLITGGAGFIGSSLADKLAEDENNKVVVIDNLLTGNRENVTDNNSIEFIEADANNNDEVMDIFKKYSFDYVYHYAAVVGVQRTLDNPLSVLEDIDGIRNILDCCVKTGVKKVFFASSSEVYGEPVEMPQHEKTTPFNSKLPYAVVKNVGESFFRTYQQVHGLDYTIFRFFNTYGPRQSTDFVMSKFIEAALKNEDITIYGKGDQTRTFCFIDDNVEATINAINDKNALNQEINIGSDKEMTILDLAETIIEALGSKSEIVFLPALEEGDMTRRKPDITKMKEIFDREFTSLEDGLKILTDYKLNKAK